MKDDDEANEENEEGNADGSEDLADSEDENFQNAEQPRRSNRLRKEPDRGGAITGEWSNVLNAELEETTEEPNCIKEALSMPTQIVEKKKIEDKKLK
eukprot:gene11645-12843_t